MANNKGIDVAIIQMDVQIGSPENNWQHIRRQLLSIVQDVKDGVCTMPDVIVLPEMWNTGYALSEAATLGDRDAGQTRSFFSAFAKEHQINVVCGSVASIEASGIYNRAIVFNRFGQEVATYAKVHLFRLMEEEKYLTPGEGLVFFELDGIRCGLMICYDLRFPELCRSYALGGAEIVFVPAQWPHPRLMHWRTLQQARAIENQMYVVTCNRVGTSGGTHFCGHSSVIDPWGERLIEGDESEQILRVTIDRSLVGAVRQRIPVFADRRPECYATELNVRP
jgi:omega-amidase